MLNFIICDDDQFFRQGMKKQIDNYMMRTDMEYKIYTFSGYNQDFEELVGKEIGFKVYFLDIKTNYGSGIDAARFIREMIEDWNSIIIIVSSFSEYRYEIITNRLFVLDFINKLDSCTKKMDKVLDIVLKSYRGKDRCLTYQRNRVYSRIELKHIYYIIRDPDSKTSTVYASHGEYTVPLSLIQIKEQLDNRFFQVYRNCIINLDRVTSVDFKKDIIRFDNGKYLEKMSREKKHLLLGLLKGKKDE